MRTGLTWQGEQQAQDDEELEPNGQPLETVQLPATAESRETSASSPCWCMVVGAALLEVPQAKQLNYPADEDEPHQRSYGRDVFCRKCHFVSNVPGQRSTCRRGNLC